MEEIVKPLITGRIRFSHGRSGCYERDIGADGCLLRRSRATPQNMNWMYQD